MTRASRLDSVVSSYGLLLQMKAVGKQNLFFIGLPSAWPSFQKLFIAVISYWKRFQADYFLEISIFSVRYKLIITRMPVYNTMQHGSWNTATFTKNLKEEMLAVLQMDLKKEQ